MSNHETPNTEQKPEKVQTKYDLKMQRRKEEKEREARSRRNGNIIGIVIVVALVCLVASFPIRTYLTVHGTYVKVNGENISKVEYDYNYNMAVSNYLNQYGNYLYMMGLDPTSDFTSQMYSETLTWGDFFQQMAVENIVRNKSLLKQAKDENFVYDVSEEYKSFEESLQQMATEGGTSVNEYRKQLYGAYATQSRLKPVVEELLYVAAYYDELSDRNAPSQEEVQAYYDENKENYDSVDYRMLTVDAELPTEPTELADPADEEAEGQDDAETGDGEDAEAAYEPSEAEIEAAMAEAKEEAEKAEKTVATEGELYENQRQSAISYHINSWLFEEERKPGDTTVIEDSTNHRYYVVSFEDRYLDDVRAVDLRLVITAEENGQAILDEWKAGAATEESFGEICDKYNNASTIQAEGGLMEGVLSSNMPAEMSAWAHEEGRAAGDTIVISPEGETNSYVVYYVGTGDEEWVLSIRQTLVSQKMSEYVSELLANGQVEDPKGHLRYLEVQAAEESAAQESSESTEASGSESQSEEASGSESQSEDASDSESQPEDASDSESQSEDASDSESQPEDASGSESQPEDASGSESQPEDASDSESQPEDEESAEGEE